MGKFSGDWKKNLGTSPEMRRLKLEVGARLAREGRKEEALAWRRAVSRELRRSGMSDVEASESAWRRCAEEFPALGVGGEVGAVGGAIRPEAGPAEVVAGAVEEVAGGAVEEVSEASIKLELDDFVEFVGRIAIPKSWGKLGTKSTWREDVDWVYENLERVRPGKQVKYPRLEKAIRPVPAGKTLTLLMWVYETKDGRDKLMAMCQKSLGGEEELEVELAKRSRQGVAEVRRILEEYLDGKGGGEAR